MTAGTLHTCGITTAGTTYCWGANDHGEIGVEPRAQCGASRCTLEPTVAAAGLSFVQVAAGASRSCGLTASGRAYCWGLGDLGDAALANQSVAPLLVSTDSTFVQLTTGSFHTCALTRSGAAYCGGLNSHGQIGDGTVTRRPVTVLAGDTLRFRRLAAGGEHTCGVALNNSLHCWGNNQWGQLGIGDVVWNTPGVYRTRPAAVGTTRSWSTVTASYSHTCAITTLREAFCWGDNGNAHVLGDETTVTYRGVPTRVAGGIPFDTRRAGAAGLSRAPRRRSTSQTYRPRA